MLGKVEGVQFRTFLMSERVTLLGINWVAWSVCICSHLRTSQQGKGRKMHQRKSTIGRPSGTDGSDFSYRMVVDPRYARVAEGKSRLHKLLLAQAISHVLGAAWLFLFASQKKGIGSLSISSIAIGFISLIIGELGRRHSQVTLLRLYSTASSVAVALSVACVIQSDFFFQVIKDRDASGIKGYELVETGRVLIGVLLQIVVIMTTVSLLQNMSPKRAS